MADSFSMKEWNVEARVERVRKIAARVYEDVTLERDSVREVMHAMALVTAAIINENFKGLGRQRAVEYHIVNVRHHQQCGQ